MKKVGAILIVIILLISVISPASTIAASSNNTKVKNAEKVLKALKKDGFTLNKTNKAGLDKSINKIEMSILLVDLIGVSKEELESNNYFLDGNPTPSQEYANYCLNNNWMNNAKIYSFEPKKQVTSAILLESLLLKLGYKKYNPNKSQIRDFEYKAKDIYKFSEKLGLIKKGEYDSKTKIIKADVIILFSRLIEMNTYTTAQRLKFELTFNPKDWINTRGEGNNSNYAGVYTYNDTFTVLNPEEDFETNVKALNERFKMMFAYVWYDDWNLRHHSQSRYSKWFPAQLLYNEAKNTYGIKIRYWRSMKTKNDWYAIDIINAYLDTFDFLSNDREVAYALWSWIDTVNMTGIDNAEDFGFQYISKSKNKETLKMNNVRIMITYNSKTKEHDVYFSIIE